MKTVYSVQLVEEGQTKDGPLYETYFYDENNERVYISKGEEYLFAPTNTVKIY